MLVVGSLPWWVDLQGLVTTGGLRYQARGYEEPLWADRLQDEGPDEK